MSNINFYHQTMNLFAHSSVPWQQEILSNFIEKIKINREGRVLDVGAGLGNNIPTLKKITENIIAIDISASALELLQKSHNMPDINIIHTNAENIPLLNESQDLVVCTEVLEHCLNPEKVIDECVRLLRPGGYLIISSPNYLNVAGLVKLFYDKVKPAESWDAWGNHSTGIENFMTSLKLKKMIASNSKLKITETVGGDFIRGYLPFLRHRYHFIDKHPFLLMGRMPVIKYFLMNFFILSVKKY